LTARAELPTRLLTASLLASAFFVGVLAGFSPPLAIGLVLAIVFLVVAMSNLTLGICLFALMTFLDTILPTEAQGTLSLPKLLGLVLMLSWLALVTAGDREQRERVFSYPAFIFVLIVFVGWALMSASWAEDPSAAIEATTRYLPNAMLFLIVFAGVRTREQLLWVVGSLVVGAFIAAAYGLVSPVPVEEGRLSGALGNANETAASLVAGGALAAALAVALRGQPILRLASAIVVPLCAIAVFMTASRGGLVALGTALIAAVLLAPGRRRPAAIALAVVVVLSTVVYFGAFASVEARSRVTELEGGTGRTDIWTVGWRMVEAEPLRGVGAGNFEVSSIHYLIAPGALIRDDFIVDEPKVAHNTYLNVLAELGVVGLALFLAIIGFALVCALRAIGFAAKSGDRQVEILARAIVVVLFALLAADFFGSRQYSKQLWLLMALCPVLLEISRGEWAARRAARSADSTGQPALRA
jgi:O-antigen ligase